ncbi:MAG: polysaccharide deacetylase family protein [Planctomycetota bacterium]|nr:polysaccharide deacetylase family protein [Planctomycetota bacterium]
MRIPIVMCHGVSAKLTPERLERYFGIAADLGFESIGYERLAAWRAGGGALPPKPIFFDFDHPVRSLHTHLLPLMKRFGFKGNLFVNTLPMEKLYANGGHRAPDREWMTWEELGELKAAEWGIGAHTHTHPNLSILSREDPTGERLRWEFETNDAILKQELGVQPKDFAFTGTSWSRAAEDEVRKRYRFGRLWIIGATYEADGGSIRYADLAGVPGPDEPDGGPPLAARYITKALDAYRLPSMELEKLIFEYEAYRRYLEGAS